MMIILQRRSFRLPLENLKIFGKGYGRSGNLKSQTVTSIRSKFERTRRQGQRKLFKNRNGKAVPEKQAQAFPVSNGAYEAA